LSDTRAPRSLLETISFPRPVISDGVEARNRRNGDGRRLGVPGTMEMLMRARDPTAPSCEQRDGQTDIRRGWGELHWRSSKNRCAGF